MVNIAEEDPVPRYFFHVFDDTVTMDEQGQVASDPPAAQAIALNSARELVCDQIKRGYLNLDNYIIVADESGLEQSRIIFREAFVIQSTNLNDNESVAGANLED